MRSPVFPFPEIRIFSLPSRGDYRSDSSHVCSDDGACGRPPHVFAMNAQPERNHVRVVRCRLSLSRVLLATAIAWLGHSAESAMAALQTDPCTDHGVDEVALCEDFESGVLHGRWEGGGPQTTWPPAFVLCGDNHGFGDQCAARSTARAAFSPLSELYVRWYQYIPASQTEGSTLEAAVTLSDPSNSVVVIADGGRRLPSQGQGITLDPDKWYLVEWHVKLNSPGVPDGVAELWIDDASRPISTQTLRLRQQDMRWLGPDDAGKQLGTLRLTARRCDEALPPCLAGEGGSSGDSPRWDHIVVSRAPIGPLVAGRLPPPPTGLRIVR
jgi:hypothetical protein